MPLNTRPTVWLPGLAAIFFFILSITVLYNLTSAGHDLSSLYRLEFVKSNQLEQSNKFKSCSRKVKEILQEINVMRANAMTRREEVEMGVLIDRGSIQ